MTSLIAFSLLFLIGFTAQQTGVCMVRAAREVVLRHRINRFVGFSLSSLVAMVVLIAVSRDHMVFISGYGFSWTAVIGGVLFAIGARINGRCATGTVVALTSGRLYHLATLTGMIAVAYGVHMFLPAVHAWQATRLDVPSPLAVYPHEVIVPIALVLCGLLGWYLYRHRPRDLAPHRWQPMLAMIILGGSSGALYALDRRWTYTALLADAAYGTLGDWFGKLLAVAVLFCGLLAGALWKNWRSANPNPIVYGSARLWACALAGGGLMGVGATLVPGGNDTMLYSGIPLLLPNLLIAYAAMLVVLHGSLWMFPSAMQGT